MVMIQAVIAPVKSVSMPTPAMSTAVSSSEPGSTVLMRCGQTSASADNARTSTAAIGNSMIARISATVKLHAGDARRIARQRASHSTAL